MVRAAHSSGTPAIGVGPGNGPAFIEKTADLKAAVRRILIPRHLTMEPSAHRSSLWYARLRWKRQ